MTEPKPPTEGAQSPERPLGLAARLELYQRAGGIVTPVWLFPYIGRPLQKTLNPNS